jgi:hypothetical protein
MNKHPQFVSILYSSGRAYHVIVASTNTDPRHSKPSPDTYTVCAFLAKVLMNSEKTTVTCLTSTSSRFVLIEHVGRLSHALELCQVEIYGACE